MQFLGVKNDSNIFMVGFNVNHSHNMANALSLFHIEIALFQAKSLQNFPMTFTVTFSCLFLIKRFAITRRRGARTALLLSLFVIALLS